MLQPTMKWTDFTFQGHRLSECKFLPGSSDLFLFDLTKRKNNGLWEVKEQYVDSVCGFLEIDGTRVIDSGNVVDGTVSLVEKKFPRIREITEGRIKYLMGFGLPALEYPMLRGIKVSTSKNDGKLWSDVVTDNQCTNPPSINEFQTTLDTVIREFRSRWYYLPNRSCYQYSVFTGKRKGVIAYCISKHLVTREMSKDIFDYFSRDITALDIHCSFIEDNKWDRTGTATLLIPVQKWELFQEAYNFSIMNHYDLRR